MTNTMIKENSLVFKNLSLYSLSHCLVDGSCIALLYSYSKHGLLDTPMYVGLIVLYNILAFGLQTPLGILADKIRKPSLFAMAGCLTIALGLLLYSPPLLTFSLVGIGNAMFHIGGGIISLTMNEQKASLPGIFVSPGSIGLLIGAFIANKGFFSPWYFILLLVAAALLMYFTPEPELNKSTEPAIEQDYFNVVVLLFLIAIFFRSLIGLSISFPWKSDFTLLCMISFAIFLGKATGGILADKIGWIKLTVPGLLIAAPCLSFGADIPFLALPGIYLLSLTTAVTLVSISNMFSGRPGIAFGLTTMAYVIGGLISFTGFKQFFCSQNVVIVSIFISALCLFIALLAYYRYFAPKTTEDKVYTVY